jgi:ABC-type phosphate transport system substrate-binding protein
MPNLKHSMKHRISAVIVGVACLCASLARADVAVVVSSKSSAGNLTAAQVTDIFLGKSSSFPGGGAAVPIDQTEGSAVRDEFYTKVTGKSAAQVKAYWSKIIFSGKGKPPKDVADSAAVKKQLADNPNAIGYIDKAAVDGTVKTVLAN